MIIRDGNTIGEIEVEYIRDIYLCKFLSYPLRPDHAPIDISILDLLIIESRDGINSIKYFIDLIYDEYH